MVTALKVALHLSIAPSAPEVKYALRTLLRLSGFGCEFVWAENGAADIYYGPAGWPGKASVWITGSGMDFTKAGDREPRSLREKDGLWLLDFGEPGVEYAREADGALRFTNDIVFASYWLLSGAREQKYKRDQRDNSHLNGSILTSAATLERPLVSLYAAFLRRHFAASGKASLPLPWTTGEKQAAFALSHDVDYPEMLRGVEFLRVLAGRSRAPRNKAGAVLSGGSHFWKFAEWVDFARRYGTQPAFYFSARRGSLAQYAAGTPDCFYDIHSARFRELFAQLRDQGCEIGLHASYNAHQDAQQLRREKESLERAAGTAVQGGRHHYWRLNPQAPHETLAHHAAMGMQYDSSLAFEFYPGFRRGVCHPFHPFHPGERRELDIVELPPTWMDDHFDRRLAMNRIADPAAPEAEVTARTEAHAKRLLDAACSTGGVAIVDYHVRGMNADFFPRYGPWLERFAEKHFDSSLRFATPRDLVRQFRDYEQQLNAASRDCTESAPVQAAPALVAASASAFAAPAATASAASADSADDACTVDLLRPEEEPAWDAFVDSHPDATIYHTLAWKRVTEECFRHKPFYLVARTGSGITGIVPLFLVGGLLGKRLVSMPLRDRGGLLTTDPQAGAALLYRATELAKELECKYLEIRSLVPIEGGLTRAFHFTTREYWVTHRLDLGPGREALWSRLDKKGARWPVKDARKKGVKLVEDSTPKGAATFHKLFVALRRGMGIPAYPLFFFESICRNLGAIGKARFYFAQVGDEILGGSVLLLHGDTAIYGYAAPALHARDYHPSDFLVWEMIEGLAACGMRWFDFGADSPHQIGLLRFKQKWGSVSCPVPYAFYLNKAKSLPALDSSTAKFHLARRTWALLPEAVSRGLGSWVTRQLS